MNPHRSTEPEQSARDFGSSLRAARELREMSQGDLFRHTKIPLRSLDALESGRFADLPADVFVRGFVRSYARVVGLPPEPTVMAYLESVRSKPDDLAFGGAAPALPQRSSSSSPDGARVSITLAVLILVLLATLTLSVLLGGRRSPGDGVAQGQPSVVESPVTETNSV